MTGDSNVTVLVDIIDWPRKFKTDFDILLDGKCCKLTLTLTSNKHHFIVIFFVGKADLERVPKKSSSSGISVCGDDPSRS